jgi:hypothetical protein
MLKRPTKRVHPSPCINTGPLIPGTLLHSIMNPSHEIQRPPQRSAFAFQNCEIYKKLLKRNYESLNIPYKEPNVFEAGMKSANENVEECHIDFLDKVYVKLNVLKSGIVRVKLVTNFCSLWEMYYSNGKSPPFKTMLAACKAVGYSEIFLNRMNENRKKRQIFAKKLEKILEKIFDKTTATKKKKVIKKVVAAHDEDGLDTEIEDDEDINRDDAEENEAIVEEDGEDDTDEVVEDCGEEVYDED